MATKDAKTQTEKMVELLYNTNIELKRCATQAHLLQDELLVDKLTAMQGSLLVDAKRYAKAARA